jgi:hypothetical protein
MLLTWFEIRGILDMVHRSRHVNSPSSSRDDPLLSFPLLVGVRSVRIFIHSFRVCVRILHVDDMARDSRNVGRGAQCASVPF